MKLRLTDTLSAAADLCSPLSLITEENGIVLSLPHVWKNVGEDFLLQYENDPFSPAAIAFLTEKTSSLLLDAGYTVLPSSRRVISRFRDSGAPLTAGHAVPFSASSYSFTSLTPACVFASQTSLLAFAAVKESELLSLAWCYEENGTLFIGVETAKNARGRGYGRDVLSSLLLACRERGKHPFYCAYTDNLPSLRLASSLGLSFVGHFYSLQGRRN